MCLPTRVRYSPPLEGARASAVLRLVPEADTAVGMAMVVQTALARPAAPTASKARTSTSAGTSYKTAWVGAVQVLLLRRPAAMARSCGPLAVAAGEEVLLEATAGVETVLTLDTQARTAVLAGVE